MSHVCMEWCDDGVTLYKMCVCVRVPWCCLCLCLCLCFLEEEEGDERSDSPEDQNTEEDESECVCIYMCMRLCVCVCVCVRVWMLIHACPYSCIHTYVLSNLLLFSTNHTQSNPCVRMLKYVRPYLSMSAHIACLWHWLVWYVQPFTSTFPLYVRTHILINIRTLERPILVYDGVSSTVRRRQKQTLKAIKVSKDTPAEEIIVSIAQQYGRQLW